MLCNLDLGIAEGGFGAGFEAGFDFFEMVLEKLLVYRPKQNSDCMLQDFIFFKWLKRVQKLNPLGLLMLEERL